MKIKINDIPVEVQEGDDVIITAIEDQGDIVKEIQIVRQAKIVNSFQLG